MRATICLTVIVLFFATAVSAPAQSQCITRVLDVPSSVSGELTISSCKNSSNYYDVYHLKDMTAGRKLRFTMTKGTIPNLHLQLQRVSGLQIVIVVSKSEFSRNTMTMDVELPLSLATYTLIVDSGENFGTGSYTLSVQDIEVGNTAMQVIPIVGHVAGVGGSEFRSDVKLLNPTGATITGRMVFTPRGQSMSDSDTSIAFSVPTMSVAFFEDVYVHAFPGGSGAARVTILPDGSAPGLIVDTSTYTALPTGGELGQNPTVFGPADYSGPSSTLMAVIGKSTERTNYFVMTGPAETTINWRYRNAQGTPSLSITRTYPPTSTTQGSVSDLFSAVLAVPSANGTLDATIQTGSARLALSPVNNVSNQGRWVDFKKKP
jgi:hypothetical protein